MKPFAINKKVTRYKTVGFLIFCLFFCQAASAHVIVNELKNMSAGDAALSYMVLGYKHIIPLGFDHILFVLSLFLLSPKLKPVLLQATAFTVAHSITLGLAMYHIIAPPANIVEPVIALSILFVALENIFSPGLKASRIGVVFLFGLVHGMGFANALGQLGLPRTSFFSSLIMFNAGVELGQITVILIAFFLLGKWFGNREGYRRFVVIPLSCLIAIVAGIWTIQRVSDSWGPQNKNITNTAFIDSLINNYTTPATLLLNSSDLQFWKARINASNPGITNESRYAATLANRFSLRGDIHDIRRSDSILKQTDSVYNHKEPGPLLALVSHSIMQHKFEGADSLLKIAKKISLKKYESFATSFDVDFELGRYDLATMDLYNIRSETDYGYNFRKSKLEHYHGDMEKAIASMLKAASESESVVTLKQAALSNAADLYMHEGKFNEAYELYHQSILLSPTDNHSMLGIGWIALTHDKNEQLAKRIFRFVQTNTKAPDPIYRLIQASESAGDSQMVKKYSSDFIKQVTKPEYGGMYNKYLIELYTELQDNANEAEMLAKKELTNRATPQTYAWYAWSLFSNNKKEDAMQIFQQYVAGKPLESLELYWMGKLVQGCGNNAYAEQFYKAAHETRFDLSPGLAADLERRLKN